jgi:LacI family transcriptional regulator
VINGEDGVSGELVTKVNAAARRLNYRHDVAASSLRRSGRKTASIGLVLEDVGNPFSSALHRAVEDVARRRGVLVLAGSSDEDPVRERDLVDAFAGRHVDGMIVVPAGEKHDYLITEHHDGTPIVFVDRPPRLFDTDSVVSANEDGAGGGVRHLVQGGHRRIAFLGDLASIPTAESRYRGYLDALRVAGIALDPALVRRGLRSSEAAETAALELLSGEQPPSAIFAAQNLLTIGAVRALHARREQERVALIGFDDIVLADLLHPGISVVAQEPAVLGRLAAELLFERLDGDRSPSRQIVVPTRLIARGSGEIAAR